ncbi:aldose reductase-like [Brachionus plicatilis]|uniref:Aldose reductase-like n=1 Tax=Brachionus plicatilis TaxID=10195 RepID=A0A3M7PDD2_BRAPC|nr:aldose reductase-like [Brachionus plicatilis]
MPSINNLKFSNGLEIPSLGLGTYKEEKEDVLVDAVKAAIKSGYRHFDCAHIYFNEQHIGKAIRDTIAESNGALKREDFFITSKCWNTYHSREKVHLCLDQILQRLGLEYLDLYLIHWPMGFKEDAGDYPLGEDGKMIPSDIHYLDTYKAMEECVRNGKTKSIGVSNFNIKQLEDVLANGEIKPVCNQVEVNPLFQNAELIEFCQKKNIVVVAYAPLGAPDRAWLKTEDPVPLQHPIVLNLAKKHNKSPAQIILRWLLQRGLVVIPKSVNPTRIEENSKIFDFNLSSEEMTEFKNFRDQFRFYKFEVADKHQFYPFE